MFSVLPLEPFGEQFAPIRGRAFLWSTALLSVWMAPWVHAQEPPDAKGSTVPGMTLVEAVRLALVHDPEIRLVESQIDTSRGAVLNAQGTFGPRLTSGVTGSDSRTPLVQGASSASESLRTDLGWSQTLRSGQTLEPQLTIDRTADATGAVNTATVSFALRQPLLRGRTGAAVTAFERAAEHELKAARLDLAHATAERLLAVASQYWTVKAAGLDLEILRSTEESSLALLKTTRRLIAAQLTPVAELVQLEADLVLRQANRIVGERNLFQEVQQLGNELGLTAERIAALALPTDPFPTVDFTQVPRTAEGYLREALERRADLLAARQRLVAEEARWVAATDNLRPQLDLVLRPSYTGLMEGAGGDDYFSSLWSQVPGVSTTFGLELTLPIHNRAAAGGEIQARALVDRRALLIERNSKRIGSRVPAALETVRRNAERLEKLEQAVGLFERTVENEGKKLRAGTSTLIDVISQRDRLTSALQGRNAARLALAIALVDLRFETGTLIAVDTDSFASVRGEDFTTLPQAAR